ncbi:MAG: nucleotidyltransferase [Erysipelotrichales bacterium]
MKVCGIVVEYNPFHNGHIYHINKAREISECDILIAIMSPTFMQRGEPAIIDKFTRTKFALDNNIDLVIELPSVYAMQSADHFGEGALTLLNELNIDTLVFGSENNNIDKLIKASKISLKEEYQDKVKEYLSDGQRYASACNLAFKDFSINNINQANDILGFSYIKAIVKYNYQIKPLSIQRTNEFLSNDINSNIASASAIRNALTNNVDISNLTPMADILIKNNNLYIDDLFDTLKYVLTTIEIDKLKEIQGFDEGLEYLFLNNIHLSNNMEDFIKRITSKRYPQTRIQRAIIHLIANISKEDISNIDVDYIRVLGMNHRGQEYLKSLNTNYNVITRFAQHKNKALDIELKLSRIYGQLAKTNLGEKEYKQPVIIKKQD